MIRINQFKNKKIYHHLMEAKSGSSVLFLFPNDVSLETFNPLIEPLQKVYKNVKIVSLYIVYDKHLVSGNSILFSSLNRETLKKYDYVFDVGEVYNTEECNEQVVGFPNLVLQNRPIANVSAPVRYYALHPFVAFQITESNDVKGSASLVDYIYSLNYKCCLFGNKIICAEIVNLTKNNPVVIYNNVFLVDDILSKADFCIVAEDQVCVDNRFCIAGHSLKKAKSVIKSFLSADKE